MASAVAVMLLTTGCSAVINTAAEVVKKSTASESAVETATVDPSESATESVSVEATPEPTPSSEAIEPAESPSPALPSATAIVDPIPELTPPGTYLKFGETAILDSREATEDDDSRMVAEVTIKSIEEGDQSALDRMTGLEGLGVADGTVYFIQATVKPIAGYGEGVSEGTWALWGVQDDGQSMVSTTMSFGEVAQGCDDDRTIRDVEFGKEYDLCRIAISAAGKEPVGVAFVRDEHAGTILENLSETTDKYVDDPVVWLQR